MAPATSMVSNSISVLDLPKASGLALFDTDALSHSIPRQYYDRYVITLVRSGYGRIFYRGVWRTFAAGEAFLLHPGEPLEGICVDKCSSILQLDADRMDGRAPRESRDGVAIENADVIAAVVELFKLASTNSSTLERESVIEQSLSRIAGPESPRARPRREQLAVRRARDFIDAHFTREIALDELAQVANLHPAYLNRVFREQLGLPPHEYQSMRRVRRASDLILRGHAIANTAIAVGFYDQSHLTRHFTRLFGFSPGVFARATRRKERTR